MSKHLKDINMSYFRHMGCALSYAVESGKAMIYFAIHALFPNIFVRNGSNKIDHVLLLINTNKNHEIEK